jgi:hypothetical protein
MIAGQGTGTIVQCDSFEIVRIVRTNHSKSKMLVYFKIRIDARTVLRQLKEFKQLDSTLVKLGRRQRQADIPRLPHCDVSRIDSAYLEQQQQLLDKYLRALSEHARIWTERAFTSFLGDGLSFGLDAQSDMLRDSRVQTTAIKSRHAYEHRLEAGGPGSVVEWDFWTLEHDIGHSAFFVADGDGELQEILEYRYAGRSPPYQVAAAADIDG